MSGEELTAVILAAGEGSRLEPVTKRRPKPMLPVVNRPLLEHIVSAVVQADVTRIVLVVGYERDRIQTHFGDGDAWDVSIEYAIQEQQLGTAHAVQQATQLVDGPFLVLNGDRIIEPSIIQQVSDRLLDRDEGETRGESVPDAVMAVTRSDQPSSYGVVTLDGNQVTDIVEKPVGESPSEIINAGVYGFQQTAFEAIRDTEQSAAGEYELPTTVHSLLSSGTVEAVRYDGRWLDVSHLWDLLKVTGEVLDDGHGSIGGTVEPGAQVSSVTHLDKTAEVGKNAVVGRGTTIAENARIGPNVTIERSVVFPDATVQAGAVVRDSIIGANATVGDNATIPRGETTMVVEDTVYESIQFGGVLGDNSVIGGGAVLEPGTIIGDTVSVGHGTTVNGVVADGTEVRRG